MNEKKSRVLHKGRTANIKDAVLIGPDSLRNEKFGSLRLSPDNNKDLEEDLDSRIHHSDTRRISTQNINNSWKYITDLKQLP